MVICLERGAHLHMAQLMPLPLTVSCFSKIQIGFTFLVPTHLGSPGQRAIKWVFVCVFSGFACCCLLMFCVSVIYIRHHHPFIIRLWQLQLGENYEQLLNNSILMHFCCIQCFDTVGWVAGRASGL